MPETPEETDSPEVDEASYREYMTAERAEIVLLHKQLRKKDEALREIRIQLLELTTQDSSLVEHAKRELELSGVDNDIYGDMTSKAVLELIRTFSDQGHSGMSASLVLGLFKQLVERGNLTPLTSDPDEWYQHAPDNWQNKRNSSCFSEDQGKTYTDQNEIERDSQGYYRRDVNGKPIQPVHHTAARNPGADL